MTRLKGELTSKNSAGLVLTCEDVLNGVGNDEVLVRDEAMNRLLVALGHCSFFLGCTLECTN